MCILYDFIHMPESLKEGTHEHKSLTLISQMHQVRLSITYMTLLQAYDGIQLVTHDGVGNPS